jgi:hypothetical protein
VTYTEHATVTSLDVVYALKRQGRTLYGFGEMGFVGWIGEGKMVLKERERWIYGFYEIGIKI